MDQKWYQDFVADGNMPREMLFDLLTAANYMGIKALLDLTCLKVTFELTGKNAEQVSAGNENTRALSLTEDRVGRTPVPPLFSAEDRLGSVFRLKIDSEASIY